jgi:hypothetical protein
MRINETITVSSMSESSSGHESRLGYQNTLGLALRSVITRLKTKGSDSTIEERND